MKFTLDSNHLEYFEQNKYIEFDSLVSEKELKEIQNSLQQALSNTLAVHNYKGAVTSENSFLSGHDLFRHHLPLRKMIMKRQWAEYASLLIQRKPIRFGYDQLFWGCESFSHMNTSSPYVKFLKQSKSLEQMSSIQEIVCGFMLCIQSSENGASVEKNSFFPQKPGNGVFIDPKAIISFSELTQNPEYQYLLITYISQSAVYVFNPDDPHTHFLKSLEYSFGDKLKEKTHPIVFR